MNVNVKSLFTEKDLFTMQTNPPLAERMRPAKLIDFVGQESLLGEGRMLKVIITSGALPSLILWGPPGSGKTTLARIIASTSNCNFVFFSAVLSGIKEVRTIVIEAEKLRDEKQIKTIFFIDEIHRFNKSQQDGLLPHVESGLFTLIGATTENPSFNVIAPLLSRCRVLVLERLSENDLKTIIQRAVTDHDHGLGGLHLNIDDQALQHLVTMADGDARIGLNLLEISATLALQRLKETGDPADSTIIFKDIEEASQHKTLHYDKNGEEHYNLISALHKSLRDSDPDGALYWLYRMLESGEDPLYICRRLIRFASEDIGVADPGAITQAISCRDAYHTLGPPEGELAIGQLVIYLATAPKSNSVYLAEKKTKKLIRESGSLPVPHHLRNAPTQLMKNLGYSKGYQYAHDHKYGIVLQDHLPEQIKNSTFYQPTNRGQEALIGERLRKWRHILKQQQKN